MKKSTISGMFFGFLFGAALLGTVGWQAMPGMMLKEAASPYDLDKTVAIIK